MPEKERLDVDKNKEKGGENEESMNSMLEKGEKTGEVGECAGKNTGKISL